MCANSEKGGGRAGGYPTSISIFKVFAILGLGTIKKSLIVLILKVTAVLPNV